MKEDTKFYFTNGAKRFKESMLIYSFSKTVGIIGSLLGIGFLALVIVNFILGVFFGNLAPAWWSRSMM